MARSIRKISKLKHHEEPQVNLTPLIDVVFVILIMFILVAPLLELDQVELADAADHKAVAHTNESSPISIHVHRDNTIAINNRKVSLDQLLTSLTELREKYQNVRPQLFHDRRAHFGTYQSVKNAVEMAGFQQLDIVLKPS